MKVSENKNVVFITGAFVTHHCWDEWQTYFQSKDYNTVAPPWPYKDAETAEELRNRQPNDTDLARLTIDEVIDSYIKVVQSFPEKPIVIGHSFGGLVTQIIVNHDLAAAGVAIHPAPPQGILPYEFSFLKAGWKAFGLLTSTDETYLMSFEDWQYAFANEMSLEEQKASYEKFAIPESKTVVRGGLTHSASIDFKKPHPPLLITSGSLDNLIPAHLNKRNFEHYKESGSVLDYKEFEGRNHFVLGLPTWKEDADYILDWLSKH
ncbi:alpha/beta hydrolase [Adhaeribacter terreus]|uniref:Alpha/beta hydrolase n=1 Tax=Adhaeribacter terreus TaxID=529703 RepID=A0ABW0EEA6_9BACT